jgi:hypothetical protein
MSLDLENFNSFEQNHSGHCLTHTNRHTSSFHGHRIFSLKNKDVKHFLKNKSPIKYY